MIAGSLELQMYANMARLADDMSKAKGLVGDTVRDIEKLLGVIGVGFSASMLVEKITSVIERMAKLNDIAEKTGVSVENLSKLQFLAGVSGSNIDSVAAALAKLSKGMVSTGNDSAAFSQALKFLGLSAKDSSGNLKGADVLYGEIAKKLYGYADGAGKMAIAQVLMGKAGAEQLPTMKKMIELGAVVASVTGDQAKAAEDYQTQVALLEQKNTILWNGIASKLLPVMSDLLVMLKNIATQMSGMGDVVSPIINAILPAIKIAAAYFALFVAAPAIFAAVSTAVTTAAGALALWAYNAMFTIPGTGLLNTALFGTAVNAQLAAGSLTALKLGAGVLFAAFAGWQIGSWLRDNFVEARIAGLTFVGLMLKGWEELKYGALLAGAAIASLIPGTDSFATASARITAAHEKEIAAIDDNIVELVRYELATKGVTKAKEEDAKKPLNFNIVDAKLAAAQLKLYQAAVKSLSDKLGNLEHQTESEKLAFELYGRNVQMADGTIVHLTGSLEKLSPEQKKVLPILAAEYDARKKIEDVLKAEIEYRKALESVMLKSQDITTSAFTAGKDQIEQYRFETDLIGKTADQMAILNAERQIELQYRQQLKSIGDAYPDGGAGMDAAIAKLDAITQALRTGLIPAMQERQALERAWATGSAAAYQEYIDTATNAARQAHDAWSAAFKGMEDDAYNLFRHGEVSGTNFVNSIKDQLARLAAQKFTVWITGEIGMGSAASSTGGGLLGGLSAMNGANSLYGMASGGYSAGVGSIGTALFGQTAGNAALASSMGMATGEAAAAATAAAEAAGMSATAASGAAAAGASLAAAVPYIAAALVAYKVFFGDHGTPTSSTGASGANYGAAGNLLSNYSPDNGYGASAATEQMVAGLQASYANTAKALGIGTVASSFSYAGNTGKNGQDPQFALGGSAGSGSFYQGETKATDADIALAASRAVFAALKGSELPSYMSRLFDGLTASTATQQQITDTLNYAASLRQVRDELTKTPLEIMAQDMQALNTSAASFKVDFVAAIDAGISPDRLAAWQHLGQEITQLAPAAEAAAVAVRSLSDIASERARLQDQYDQLTMTSAQLLTKQRDAIDASNQSLFDQVQAAQVAKDSADALAQSNLATAAAMATLAATNKTWQDQLDVLTGAQTDRSIALRDATDDSTRALMQQVYAQQDLKTAAADTASAIQAAAQTSAAAYQKAQQDAASAVSAAQNTLTTAYQREASAMQTTIDKFAGFSQSLLRFRDSLLIGSLSTLSPEQQYQTAKAAFDKTRSLAMSGDQTALGDLQNVSQQFLTASQGYNASTAAYASDFAAVQSALTVTAGTSMTQAGLAQAQLTELQSSVRGLIDINTSVISVRDAVLALQTAKSAATTAAQMDKYVATSGGVNPADGAAHSAALVSEAQAKRMIVESLAQGYTAADVRLGGVRNWGFDLADINRLGAGLPGFANGGFANGLFQAGERGTEIMYTPSPVRVMSHSQSNAAVIDGGEVVKSLKEQITELRAIVAQQSAGFTALLNELVTSRETSKDNTRKMAREKTAGSPS